MMLAVASVSLTSMAQETEATEKYSVATNSFWSNWFVQGGVQWSAVYASAEHGMDLSRSPFKSFRSNPQASVAIGKWFTPGMGLRTKVSGIWGKAMDESFKYWNVQEQALFNVSNMLCGYNPERVYSFIPFLGAGVARNMKTNSYSMGYSVGILNQFRVCKRASINLELGWNRFENDFFSNGNIDNGERFWDSHDNLLYAEVGVTVNLGKTGWSKVPDVDAIKALSQSQIDALNAQLNDANAENARLKKLLAEKKEESTKGVKEFANSPVSVFFSINKYKIASRKDLVNVKEMAKYAKENDANILVTGYADSATGKPAYNQKLSEKRANTVADEIVKMGVSRDKITTEAKGGVNDLSPISYNRRATVQIKD